LKCTSGTAQETEAPGGQYLTGLLQRLSNMRGGESWYLQPLLSKAQPLVTYPMTSLSLSPSTIIWSASNELGTDEAEELIRTDQIDAVVY
jgi:hypothetical protein